LSAFQQAKLPTSTPALLGRSDGRCDPGAPFGLIEQEE
jgi:hypothetical protein